MGLDAHILTITEPTIVVDKLAAVDMGEREAGGDPWDNAAADLPYVKINGYVFQPKDIESFVLKLTGKFPEVSMIIKDKDDVFTVSEFPRDGDVLSLRLKARGDNYKDIRMDFHITEFRGFSATITDKAAGKATFSVRGLARLPGMYTDACKSYGKGTSYDHLIKIAEDLKLGFATNVDTTSDEMTRICAYQTKFEMLDNTVLHSYISDDTFQTYSIDPYYYVNFIDLQKIFNAKEEIEPAELRTTFTSEKRAGDSTSGDTGTNGKLILSNHTSIGGTANFIEAHNLINNSTNIALQNGYKRYLQYYDVNSEMSKSNENLNEFFAESLVSSTIKENEEPLKGRRNSSSDEYNSHIKHKFLGIHDSNPTDGNVHLNWGFSAINNIQNLVELDKMKLVVTLSSFNPAIYRYMKLPVTLYNYSAKSREVTKVLKNSIEDAGFQTKNQIETDAASLSDEGALVDEFLTAYYVVMGIEYTYSPTDGKKQVLHLARKEWPARMNNM